MKIRIVFTGRGYDAGESLPASLDLSDDATVDRALDELNARLPKDRPLSSSCLVAVSGRHIGTVADHTPQALCDGDEIVLIAPVAGGA